MSAVPRLLGLRVRMPPGAWMSVSFECMCCQRSRGWANPPYRRVLPNVVCLSVNAKTHKEYHGPELGQSVKEKRIGSLEPHHCSNSISPHLEINLCIPPQSDLFLSDFMTRLFLSAPHLSLAFYIPHTPHLPSIP
jgi:hypothetical protein